MRVFLVVTLAAVGCSHGLTPSQFPSHAGTNVAVMNDSMPGGTFPQISDFTRAWSHGSLLAAPDAPLCSLDLKSSTVTWDEVQTPIESRHLKAIALRLPPGFRPAWYSHARGPHDDDPEEFADSGRHWGHMLGSWDRFDETSAGTRISGFTIWIGPEEGYPSWYIGGAEVRQVSFSECRVQTDIGVLPVALFAVESPEPMIGGYVVVTYARIQDGVYIRASGQSPDSTSQSLLLATVSTLRLVR